MSTFKERFPALDQDDERGDLSVTMYHPTEISRSPYTAEEQQENDDREGIGSIPALALGALDAGSFGQLPRVFAASDALDGESYDERFEDHRNTMDRIGAARPVE